MPADMQEQLQAALLKVIIVSWFVYLKPLLTATATRDVTMQPTPHQPLTKFGIISS